MEERPFTVTKQDGTVIQLKWRKKKEKSKPVVIKELDEKPPSPKHQKLISEEQYINKCLKQIKHDLNLQENTCKFKFYEFKGIPLLTVMVKDIKFSGVYTVNLHRMTPTTKYNDHPHCISEKSISRLQKIISQTLIINKEFTL